MSSLQRHGDLMAAALTPLRGDMSCDEERLVRHCADLLARGCRAVVLFGTTGEGASFSPAERIAALRAVVANGVPADRLLLGLIGNSLPDLIWMTREAGAIGAGGVVMLPPFFYRDVGQDGLLRMYSEVITGAGPTDTTLYLYNFPEMCGSVLTPELVDRLRARFPDVIVGLKDSSGDWTYTADLLQRFPDLDIYVGHEPHLDAALRFGARGGISGLANVVPERLLAQCCGELDGDGEIPHLVDHYGTLPFVAASKAVLAALSSHAEWRHVRPPLEIVAADAVAPLVAACRRVLERSGAHEAAQ